MIEEIAAALPLPNQFHKLAHVTELAMIILLLLKAWMDD
jgi:hypothetical protein